MKKLLVILAILAFVPPVWSQATSFNSDWCPKIIGTLDDTDADSLTIGLPSNRGKGLIMGYLKLDSLKAQTALDSVNVLYRQAFFGSVTRTDSAFKAAACWYDGVIHPFVYAQIYKGVDAGTVNFGPTVTAIIPANRLTNPGGRIPLLFDMDGYPWRAMQIIIKNIGGLADDVDSIRYTLDFDID